MSEKETIRDYLKPTSYKIRTVGVSPALRAQLGDVSPNITVHGKILDWTCCQIKNAIVQNDKDAVFSILPV